MERRTIRISSLDNGELPLYSSTVLKDGTKPRYKSLPTLRYLLEFLDAYDFASESIEDVQETAKTIINASVLGLIFEKINGHKDGSVFTPGAVTMYMSREAIHTTVVRKFNEGMGWNCPDYEALKDKDIDDYSKANAIVDSIRICDPAVGSGHFLVSVLNEIIRTKYDLGILMDCNGKRIKKQDWTIEIENDELIVSDSDGVPFVYIPGNDETQRIQEALFNEKRKIIENCLFGVDLNPNAVNICRLRLWIELLKNAYYTKVSGYSELETLPNIDINIKVGNSLVHRFDLKQDISEILKKNDISISQYKDAVTRYKNAHSKDEKRELEEMLSTIKSNLRTQISQNDPKVLRKTQLERELNDLIAPKLFEISKKEQMQQAKQEKVLRTKIGKLNGEIEEIRNNKMFVGAFEWRIEFPEILDETGHFIGFDCIIGNPPYIQLQKMGADADALQKMGYVTYERTGDIYCLFYEMGMELLKPNALLSFITSNGWLKSAYGKPLRTLLTEKYNPSKLIDFAGFKVFDSATVDVNILNVENRIPSKFTSACSIKKESFDIEKLSDYVETHSQVSSLGSDAWAILSDIEQSIKAKVESIGMPLKEWDIEIFRGVLTGCNDAFIITSEKRDEILANCIDDAERERTAELIRPILRGRDIKRYGYDWANLWLINTHNGVKDKIPSINIEDYPTLKAHLNQYWDKIHDRADQGDTPYNLRNCAYLEDFLKPKIVWGEISDRSKFAYDHNGNFAPEATTFLMVGENLPYLLCVLNCPLSEWFFSKVGTTTGVGTVRWKKYTIENLLIPNITKEKIKIFESSVSNYLTGKISATEFSQFVNNQIYIIVGLTHDEIDFVEHFYP